MEITAKDPMIAIRLQAAKYVLGLVNSDELILFANRVLSDDISPPSLIELAITDRGRAFLKPMMSDVGPLFESALEELHLPLPSRHDAIWMLARHCVEQIQERNVSPLNALNFLCWDLRHAAENEPSFPKGGYVGEELDISALYGIYDSYSCPNETYYEPEQREIENEHERCAILDHEAREEAAAWLERHPQ